MSEFQARKIILTIVFGAGLSFGGIVATNPAYADQPAPSTLNAAAILASLPKPVQQCAKAALGPNRVAQINAGGLATIADVQTILNAGCQLPPQLLAAFGLSVPNSPPLVPHSSGSPTLPPPGPQTSLSPVAPSTGSRPVAQPSKRPVVTSPLLVSPSAVPVPPSVSPVVLSATPPASPFAHLNTTTQTCIKTALGVDRFRALKQGTPPSPDDQSKIQAAKCFQGHPPAAAGSASPASLPPGLQGCLASSINPARLKAISDGSSRPTPAEQEKGAACYQQFDKSAATPPSVAETLPSSVQQCLELALGTGTVQDLGKGTAALTQTDRAAAYACLGQTSALAPKPTITMPASLQQCLQAAVGQTRFNAISSGDAQPTADEQAKGQQCLTAAQAKTDSLSTTTVLPPSPQEVPFIPEAKSLQVTSVKVAGTKTQITGTADQAQAGAIVDITIFSDNPKQFSTTVSQDGSWSTSYDGALASAVHHVYAVVRQAGASVRSAATQFQVTPAEAAAQSAASQSVSQTMHSTIQRTPRITVIVLSIVGGVLLIGGITFLVIKIHHA